MWLHQAGVTKQYVKHEDAGITGNEHEMMLKKSLRDRQVVRMMAR
jgi:hypothetical protein